MSSPRRLSAPAATLFEQVFERARRRPVTTRIPPAHSKIAAPRAWGAATVQEVWDLSDRAGIPPCTLLGIVQQLVFGDAEHVCDGGQSREGHRPLAV